MRYARIENEVVKEIGEFDSIEGRFHPSLTWVECSAEVNTGWVYGVGGVFSAPLAIPITKADVSAKRYAIEVAGINFTYRTVPTSVSTTRETRASMLGAYNSAKEGRWAVEPATETDFKFGDGVFRPATAQEVIDIYIAVERHVKACYDTEGQKFAEIDATGTTDLDTNWPATVNTPSTIYFGK